MRLASVLLLALPLSLAAGAPDSKTEVNDLRNHPFSADLPSGVNLRVHLRSGDFRIVGRDNQKLSVRLEGRSAENAKDVTIRFERHGGDAHLRVYGGPKNDVQVVVEVPKTSSLFVRMPAGDLTIEDVVGSKDVQLHAGDLTISVGNPAEYARVDASVLFGDIQASPFGESHSGMFRSFEKHGSGQYHLHAHVGAGDLTFR